MDRQVAKFWERYDNKKASRSDSFYEHMLDRLMERAADGEAAAIEFLEKRGLIEFPNAGSR